MYIDIIFYSRCTLLQPVAWCLYTQGKNMIAAIIIVIIILIKQNSTFVLVFAHTHAHTYYIHRLNIYIYTYGVCVCCLQEEGGGLLKYNIKARRPYPLNFTTWVRRRVVSDN